jgi:hypothetical protein
MEPRKLETTPGGAPSLNYALNGTLNKNETIRGPNTTTNAVYAALCEIHGNPVFKGKPWTEKVHDALSLAGESLNLGIDGGAKCFMNAVNEIVETAATSRVNIERLLNTYKIHNVQLVLDAILPFYKLLLFADSGIDKIIGKKYSRDIKQIPAISEAIYHEQPHGPLFDQIVEVKILSETSKFEYARAINDAFPLLESTRGSSSHLLTCLNDSVRTLFTSNNQSCHRDTRLLPLEVSREMLHDTIRFLSVLGLIQLDSLKFILSEIEVDTGMKSSLAEAVTNWHSTDVQVQNMKKIVSSLPYHDERSHNTALITWKSFHQKPSGQHVSGQPCVTFCHQLSRLIAEHSHDVGLDLNDFIDVQITLDVYGYNIQRPRQTGTTHTERIDNQVISSDVLLRSTKKSIIYRDVDGGFLGKGRSIHNWESASHWTGGKDYYIVPGPDTVSYLRQYFKKSKQTVSVLADLLFNDKVVPFSYIEDTELEAKRRAHATAHSMLKGVAASFVMNLDGTVNLHVSANSSYMFPEDPESINTTALTIVRKLKFLQRKEFEIDGLIVPIAIRTNLFSKMGPKAKGYTQVRSSYQSDWYDCNRSSAYQEITVPESTVNIKDYNFILETITTCVARYLENIEDDEWIEYPKGFEHRYGYMFKNFVRKTLSNSDVSVHNEIVDFLLNYDKKRQALRTHVVNQRRTSLSSRLTSALPLTEYASTTVAHLVLTTHFGNEDVPTSSELFEDLAESSYHYLYHCLPSFLLKADPMFDLIKDTVNLIHRENLDPLGHGEFKPVVAVKLFWDIINVTGYTIEQSVYYLGSDLGISSKGLVFLESNDAFCAGVFKLVKDYYKGSDLREALIAYKVYTWFSVCATDFNQHLPGIYNVFKEYHPEYAESISLQMDKSYGALTDSERFTVYACTSYGYQSNDQPGAYTDQPIWTIRDDLRGIIETYHRNTRKGTEVRRRLRPHIVIDRYTAETYVYQMDLESREVFTEATADAIAKQLCNTDVKNKRYNMG